MYKGTALKLPVPTRDDHTFLGWFESETASSPVNADAYSPTKNITLVAKWKSDVPGAETYTVTFECDCGETHDPLVYKGAALKLPVPTRDGHTFLGWFESETASSPVNADAYTPTKNIALVAKWKSDAPAEDKTIVTFESNGGTKFEPVEYNSGAISLPVPERYNYEFAGWFDNKDMSGNAISGEYTPTASITLYAKWTAVTYIYMYYGASTDHRRLTYSDGDTVEFKDISFTPDDITVDGTACPFVKWVYEDTDTEPTTIEVGRDNIIIVAVYDYSALPPKSNLTQNSDGSYTATGNVAHTFVEKTDDIRVWAADVTFTKSMSGGAGIAFRMNMSGSDYAYEDSGSTYLSAVIIAASGKLQVSSVTDGKFAQLAGSQVAFESLPDNFKYKYNNGINVSIELAVVDYGDKFEIYIDRELCYTYTDAAKLANYTGNGFGIRCSARGAEFENLSYNTTLTVSFDANGGTTPTPVTYTFGKLELPTSEKEGVVLGGWYYDDALSQKVNPNFFRASSDITLYAGWSTDYYTVTLDSLGGGDFEPIKYVDGSLALPVPQKENHIFTKWYYDSNLTSPVDEQDPIITNDTTLYAGYRLPKGNITDNGDGTFTATANTAVLLGVGTKVTFDITMDITLSKGGAGAIGILLRGMLPGDNSWESGCKYISVQLVAASGNLQVSRINNGFAHMSGTPISLSALPRDWQNKFNAAASGETISAVLKVEARTDGFRVYIDGALAYTYTNATVLQEFTSLGYGIRSSHKGSTFALDYKEINTSPITVTFVSDGQTVSTVESETDGVIAMPAATQKADVTQANGNVTSYTFDGWYIDGEPFNSVKLTKDTTAVAAFKEKITRNGIEIVTENNETKYVATGTRATQQGFTLPDIEMQGGVYSYTVTCKKPKTTSNEFSIRTLFYVRDAGSINLTGTGTQALPFITINLANGTLFVGKKINNSSQSVFCLKITDFKECAYTRYFTSVAGEGDLTLDFRIVFEKGMFKYYINDCLLIVYGGMDYTGETLYGEKYDETSATMDNNKYTAALKEFDAYINDPDGFKVGIQMWHNTSIVGGRIEFSNVVCEQSATPEQTAVSYGETAYIRSKETA